MINQKVIKQAKAIADFIQQGKLDEADVNKLVRFGVDAEAVKYYKNKIKVKQSLPYQGIAYNALADKEKAHRFDLPDGTPAMKCINCSNDYPYAEANQVDKSFKCRSCIM